MYSTIDILNDATGHWRELFESYRQHILSEFSDYPLIDNYNEKNLQIAKQLGFFVTIDTRTNAIAKFSTVFRPSHWPTSVVRIYNRTWVDPAYRASGLQAKPDYVHNETEKGQSNPLEQQVQCAENNGAELIVLSREFRAGFVSRALAVKKLMNRRKRKWDMDLQNVYLTYNSRSNYSCWQILIYHEIVGGAVTQLNNIPSMSIADYKEMFSMAIADA